MTIVSGVVTICQRSLDDGYQLKNKKKKNEKETQFIQLNVIMVNFIANVNLGTISGEYLQPLPPTLQPP